MVIRLGIWLVATVVAVSGQPADFYQREILRAADLLKSPQWRDKAWGAHLAGSLRANDLNDELIDQLRKATTWRSSSAGTEEHTFITSALHGLIEAGAKVPATVLEPYLETWPDATIILLARDSANDEVLLRLTSEQPRDVVWLVANNLLAERKSALWYSALLRELVITHRFVVLNPDQAIAMGAGEGGGFCGDGVVGNAKDFPPMILYTLSDKAERDSVLLVKGPKNVYYRRTIVPPGKQSGWGSCGTILKRMELRLGYLAQLRPISLDVISQLFQGKTYIRYTTDNDFAHACESSMAAQEQGIQRFLQELGTTGLAVPGIALKIVAQVEDQRVGVKSPLPAVTPRVIHVNSSSAQ